MENSNQARDVIDGQLSSADETILGYSQMIGRRALMMMSFGHGDILTGLEGGERHYSSIY